MLFFSGKLFGLLPSLSATGPRILTILTAAVSLAEFVDELLLVLRQLLRTICDAFESLARFLASHGAECVLRFRQAIRGTTRIGTACFGLTRLLGRGAAHIVGRTTQPVDCFTQTLLLLATGTARATA